MASPWEIAEMKRRVAVLALGILSPFMGWPGVGAERAEASGGALCAVSGTIRFSPSPSPAQAQGRWHVEPAVISCHGVFRAYERITGSAPFTGSGTYTVTPAGDGCLHYVGSGEVDYTLPTTEADVRIVERHDFVLAAAGTFTTPSLKGAIQAVLPDGDCITTPVTEATFLAEGMLVRVNGLHR